jgi:hypothetical protein
MTTTAGHSFYIGPIGSFYYQVNDTGSWEPLVDSVCTRLKCKRSWVQSLTMQLVFAAVLLLSRQHSGVKTKTGGWELRVLFLTGATYLHAYYCFSGVAPKKKPSSTSWSSTKQAS